MCAGVLSPWRYTAHSSFCFRAPERVGDCTESLLLPDYCCQLGLFLFVWQHLHIPSSLLFVLSFCSLTTLRDYRHCISTLLATPQSFPSPQHPDWFLIQLIYCYSRQLCLELVFLSPVYTTMDHLASVAEMVFENSLTLSSMFIFLLSPLFYNRVASSTLVNVVRENVKII